MEAVCFEHMQGNVSCHSIWEISSHTTCVSAVLIWYPQINLWSLQILTWCLTYCDLNKRSSPHPASLGFPALFFCFKCTRRDGGRGCLSFSNCVGGSTVWDWDEALIVRQPVLWDSELPRSHRLASEIGSDVGGQQCWCGWRLETGLGREAVQPRCGTYWVLSHNSWA